MCPAESRPAAGPQTPLLTWTSCSRAAGLGTAGKRGTIRDALQAGGVAGPPAGRCAKAGEGSAARGRIWPARGGVAIALGKRVLGICYARSQQPGKRSLRSPRVTEGVPEAPRSGEVPGPGRSEARPETLAAHRSASGQPPRTPAPRGSPRAPWPPSAPGVQAPSPNLLPRPHVSSVSPRAPSQLLLTPPSLLAPLPSPEFEPVRRSLFV